MMTLVPPQSDPQALAAFADVVTQASPTQGISEAFNSALRALAKGEAVRIEPLPELLTTSQAADLLGVSRTTMVKLLEGGKLPYQKPNVHRLVALTDVLEYRETTSKKRRDFLGQTIRESVDDGTFFTTVPTRGAGSERTGETR